MKSDVGSRNIFSASSNNLRSKQNSSKPRNSSPGDIDKLIREVENSPREGRISPEAFSSINGAFTSPAAARRSAGAFSIPEGAVGSHSEASSSSEVR